MINSYRCIFFLLGGIISKLFFRLLPVAIISCIFILGCTPDHPQSTFNVAGPVAESQLTLFYWILAAAVFVFVIVTAILFWAVFRYRRKVSDKDPEQIHGNTKLEIAWTILPAIILVFVAIPTVITIFDNANSPCTYEEGCLEVTVEAAQWFWNFTYKDPSNPDLEVMTSNEMRIPVDEVVNIKLTSRDVLHSFWIPNIAGKLDIVPNHVNTMWIQSNIEGEFYAQCAEFCGIAHALMSFRVYADSRDEFNEWMKLQATEASIPAEPLALEGKKLFEGEKQCYACHKVMGTKARSNVGPDLTHVASRTQLAAGILDNTQDNLRKWLEDPESIKPGNKMARQATVYTDETKKLNDPEISALVAYLQTLK